MKAGESPVRRPAMRAPPGRSTPNMTAVASQTMLVAAG
jgi:hypothetical protein